ncbi:probable E3 ubiquitin-protein ligase CHIP at N-terminal half [Coccomyxa sp. Obi]|nr:probable E3 ubiquitin-protein ligase CHIP at N-terminal half [Coccomyxa sp. Obi]
MSNFDANSLISSPLGHHLQTDRISSFSFHPKEETPFPKNSGPLSDALLETPTDLVCPITLQVFKDPVITSSGQVYERHAIVSHLEKNHNDPISRLPLRIDQLTPVYVLRVRAAEYRESAAAACIQAACSAGCTNPVQYVRRAVDLADGITVPGLSPECVQYVKTHPSNACDVQVMEVFAQGLISAVQKANAAAVYGTLLTAGLDKAQQCAHLRAWVECWTQLPGELDDTAMRKLEEFVEGQSVLRWSRVIDLVEAVFSGPAAVALCEYLLFPGSSTVAGTAAPEARLREVTLRYMQLQLRSVGEAQGALERRVMALEAASQESPPAEEASVREKRLFLRRPHWMNSRVFASAALTVATVAGAGGHPVLKLLSMFPLLYLIPPDGD